MAGEVIKGDDFIIYINIGGENKAICRSKDTKLTITADLVETTTKDSKKFKTYNYQGKATGYLSVTGLTNYIDGANFYSFQQAILNSTKLPFLFTDGYGVEYTGYVLVPTIDIDSPDNAISSFNTTLQIDGNITIVYTGGEDPPPVPTNVVTIIDQFGNVIATVAAPGSFAVLQFDTIDARGWASPDLIIIPRDDYS